MLQPLNSNLQAKLANYHNIPEELKALKQWVCWRYEDIGASKPTKVPYYPLTSRHASVTNPQTWCTFVEASEAVSKALYDGIGFVFTDKDPYTFIDLDNTKGDTVALNRQIKIFQEFDSYSEVSPSGQGLHVIIKGVVPGGRKRSAIEVYSLDRYATFTGNIYQSKNTINERQGVLSQLWEQMGASIPQTMLFTGDKEEKHTDAQIINIASQANNGEKFKTLLSGDWQSLYKSQSEADFAFIDIVAFYTQNRMQIARLFRASPLGQRDKAKRTDYVEYMINQSFDTMLPQLDIEGFNIEIDKIKMGVSVNGKPAAFEAVNEGSIPSAPTIITNTKFALKPPPGLLGEIASFIYQASPRPVPEIALAGAIGLMAGISGRAYNVSATGLNTYVLLLANTGSGKEAIQAGISKLIDVIKQQVPTAPYFVGPSEIASGQALFRYIGNSSKCFVCVLGEFGLRMMQMANQNANGAEVSLRRMLLDLYNKSGFKDVLQPTIYADKDKNIGAVPSPAFSICGESTPERFYNNLNEDMISEGLLPRFLLIEYTGPRVPFNEHHSDAQPSFSLIEKLATLAANSETIQHANPRRVVNVKFTGDALQISKAYDVVCDKKINETGKDVVRQLWNRAHVKVLKLAALVAVGINMFDPVIEEEHINWAIDMVNNDIETLTTKFEEGKIGTNTVEIKQIDMIINTIKEYVMKDWEFANKYAGKDEKSKNLHSNKVVTYAFVSRRLISQAAFRLDKMGATNAIKRCLQTMIDRDYIREIGKHELATRFGSTQRAFVVSNTDILK